MSTESAVPAASTEDWWGEVWAVFRKDLRSELRTRAAISTILLFAVVTLIIVAYTVPREGEGLTVVGLVDNYRELLRRNLDAEILHTVPEGTQTRHLLLSALLWIILFFSAMAGLPRTFVKEEEMGTAPALRLTARSSAVFTGKLLFNAGLMLGVTAVVLPLYLVLLIPWIRNWPLFLAFVTVGSVGMACSATIIGAMVARAGGKAYLMLPLAFPILLPILVFSINGTAAASRGIPGNQMVALVSYVVAMVTLSALLFDRVWSDA